MADVSLAESQRVVACAALKRPADLDELSLLVEESDFDDWFYGRVYGVCLDLARRGVPVDVGTVVGVLKAAPHQFIDDNALFVALGDTMGGPAGNAAWHARRVRDARTLALLRDAGAKIALLGGVPPDQAFAQAGELLAAVEGRRLGGSAASLDDVLHRTAEAIDRRLSDPAACGLPSGIDALDQITGGFHPGELTVLAARPSRGKTAVALTFAAAAAGAGTPVLFASLEQRDVELGERLLAAAARVDGRVVRAHHMTPEARGRLYEAGNALSGLQLYIDDTPRQSAHRVAAQARRLKRRRGLAMVLVDYVGLVDTPERPGKKRYELVGEVTKALRVLARELAVPVVALAQLGRGVEDRGKDARPRLSDLYESGNIEQDADVAILLHVAADDVKEAVWPMELIVAKQRNGPVGTATARFVKGQMRFEVEPTPFAGGGVRRAD